MRALPLVVGFTTLAALFLWRDSQTRRQLDEIAVKLAAAQLVSCPAPIVRVVDSTNVEAALAHAAEPMRKPADAPAPKIERTPEPTYEQARALDSARETLDAALARGRLDTDDVLEMRKQLAFSQSPEEAGELTRQIAVALNTGKLIPQDPRTVFP